MPKELHEIKTFISGTITSVDDRDLPEDAASFSLNIDPIAEDGKLRGIPTDKTIIEYQEYVGDSPENPELVNYPINPDGGGVKMRANASSMAIINNEGIKDLLYFDTILGKFVLHKDLYNEDDDEDDGGTVSVRRLLADRQSIVVNSHRAHIGMGQNEIPQWAGYIKHKNMLSDVDSGEFWSGDSTFEQFGEGYGAYQVDKWCRVYDGNLSDITPEDATTGLDDTFIYGIQQGSKYIYRMKMNGEDITSDDNYTSITSLGANVQRSKVVTLGGEPIDNTFDTISTCRSHSGCVLVGVDGGGLIYKINVADAQFNTVDSNDNPTKHSLFNTDLVGGGGFTSDDQFYFDKHVHVVATIKIKINIQAQEAEGARLGDIVESGKINEQWNLWILFYKPQGAGFGSGDRFLFHSPFWIKTLDDSAVWTQTDPDNGSIYSHKRGEPLTGEDTYIFTDKSPTIDTCKKITHGGTNYYNSKYKVSNKEGPNLFYNMKGYDKVKIHQDGEWDTFDADTYHSGVEDTYIGSLDGYVEPSDQSSYEDELSYSEIFFGGNIGFITSNKKPIRVMRYGLIDINYTRTTPYDEGMVAIVSSSIGDFAVRGGKRKSRASGLFDRTWSNASLSKKIKTNLFLFIVTPESSGANQYFGDEIQIIKYGKKWLRFFRYMDEVDIDDIVSVTYDPFTQASSDYMSKIIFFSVKYEDELNNANRTKLYAEIIDTESSELSFWKATDVLGLLSEGEGGLGEDAIDLPIGSASILNKYGSSNHKIWTSSKTTSSNIGYVNGYAETASGSWVFDTGDDSSSGGTSGDNFYKFTNLPPLISFEGINSNGSATDAPEGHFDNGKKYRYKVAFEYDNLQIGTLSSNTWVWESDAGMYDVDKNKRYKAVKINIRINKLPPRVTRVYLYRKDPFDENEPEAGSYVNVFPFGINVSSGWSYDEASDTYSRRLFDKGNIGQSFESMSLFSEVMTRLQPNYELSTRMNDYLYIAKCSVPGEIDDYSQYVFRSISPSNWSAFNWVNDFILLPSIPKALTSYNGRLFAFDENNTYIINASGIAMEMQDKLEGIGCLSQDSFVSTEYGLFIADDSNIYQYDGTNTIPIGNAILEATGEGFEYSWINRNKNVLPKLAFDGRRGCLLVSFNSGNDNPSVWSFNVVRRRWDLWEYTGNIEGEGLLSEYIFSSGANNIKVKAAPTLNGSYLSSDIFPIFEHTIPARGMITSISKDGMTMSRENITIQQGNLYSYYINNISLNNVPLSYTANNHILLLYNLPPSGSFPGELPPPCGSFPEELPPPIDEIIQAIDEIIQEFSFSTTIPVGTSGTLTIYNEDLSPVAEGNAYVDSVTDGNSIIKFSNEQTSLSLYDSSYGCNFGNYYIINNILPSFPSDIGDAIMVELTTNDYQYYMYINFKDYTASFEPLYEDASTYWTNDVILSPGDYTINASDDCSLDDSFGIPDSSPIVPNEFKIENTISRNPTSFISGYKGEIIACDGFRITEYLGGDLRRKWTWKSKDISLKEDNKFKKFYNVNMTTNLEQLSGSVMSDIPQATLSNTFGAVNSSYSVNGEDGIFHSFTDKGFINPEHRKSKSIKIKVESDSSIENAELSSISLTYRRLPNTSGNY